VFPVLFQIPNAKTMAGELLVLEVVVGIASLLVWIALKLRRSESWVGGAASTVAILLMLHVGLSLFMKTEGGEPKDIPIYSFGVVIILAFLAGAYFMMRQTDKLGLDRAKVFDWGFWLLVVGIVGARLFYAFLNWDSFTQDKWALLRIWEGGLVWYGGLIPAAVAAFILLTRYKLPVLPVADVAAVALMLSLGIGRWACLLAGDDYGSPTDSWLGIRFYHPQALIPMELRGTAEHAAVALHPTQLYMSVNCLWLFFVLEWIRRRARWAGQTVAWMLVLYAVTRALLIEPFRGDFVERNPAWGKHVAAELTVAKDGGAPAVHVPRGAAASSEKRAGSLLSDLDLPAGKAKARVWVLSDAPAAPLTSAMPTVGGRKGDEAVPPWPVTRIEGLPPGADIEVGAVRWYRSDLPQPPGYVSTSQTISIGVVAAGLLLLWFVRRLRMPAVPDAA